MPFPIPRPTPSAVVLASLASERELGLPFWKKCMVAFSQGNQDKMWQLVTSITKVQKVPSQFSWTKFWDCYQRKATTIHELRKIVMPGNLLAGGRCVKCSGYLLADLEETSSEIIPLETSLVKELNGYEDAEIKNPCGELEGDSQLDERELHEQGGGFAGRSTVQEHRRST